MIDRSLLGLCLDTGHFRSGGADPTRFVHDYHEIIRHVHIQGLLDRGDGRGEGRGQGPPGRLERGVFTRVGLGDSGIDSVIEALRAHDYRGWLVIEQDQFLRAADTRESVVAVQRQNRDYLRRLGI